MLASEKQKLLASLVTIQTSITRFDEADKRAITDTYWYALCTDSQAARIFFRGIQDNIVTRITVCTLAANAYKKLIDCNAIPPVITSSDAEDLRKAAQALKKYIPGDVPLPKAVQTADFNDGLAALCVWVPGQTVLSDYKGDSGRRWTIRELAKGFAWAFNKVPVEFIHAIILIGWPDAPLRSISRELDRDVIAQILDEVKAERVQELKVFSAEQAAKYAVQRISKRAITLSDKQTEEIDQLQARIDRIRAGMPQFPSEAQHLRAIITLTESLPDSAMASEISEQIRLIGNDYAIPL